MAGVQFWERNLLWFSPELRDGGRQLKSGEVRQSICHNSYVRQVVCLPRHHAREASPLKARDSPPICLPMGSHGQIRGVYGASQTPKAKTGERRTLPTPALIAESAPAPPSAMEYSSCVRSGPELPVTGPIVAISYPLLIWVPVHS